MKHGKRLTLYEKILLKSKGNNPEDYLRTKRVNKHYEFINIINNEPLLIDDINDGQAVRKLKR